MLLKKRQNGLKMMISCLFPSNHTKIKMGFSLSLIGVNLMLIPQWKTTLAISDRFKLSWIPRPCRDSAKKSWSSKSRSPKWPIWA